MSTEITSYAITADPTWMGRVSIPDLDLSVEVATPSGAAAAARTAIAEHLGVDEGTIGVHVVHSAQSEG